MGFFLSYLHSENLVGILVGIVNVWRLPPRLDPLEFLTVRLVHAEPSEIHLSELRFSSLGTISRRMVWSGLVILWAVILSFCLYLFNLGERGLPCNLTSLLDINRVIDFQLVKRFPCCKFLTCWTGNQKSSFAQHGEIAF